MPRFFASIVFFGSAAVLGAVTVLACGSTDLEAAPTSPDAGLNIRRDSAIVEPAEAGAYLDASVETEASCEKYCDLVTVNCTGAYAQYASGQECLAFCKHLPLRQASRAGEDKESASIACRQYWADAPSKTSPESYCLAAGPFGGNTCGDRCTAFCDAVLSACSPDAPNAPYDDQPQCATACAAFSYRDAGADGGGEGPNGPTAGDSLNCRLHQLRKAIATPSSCATLSAVSETCKD